MSLQRPVRPRRSHSRRHRRICVTVSLLIVAAACSSTQQRVASRPSTVTTGVAAETAPTPETTTEPTTTVVASTEPTVTVTIPLTLPPTTVAATTVPTTKPAPSKPLQPAATPAPDLTPIELGPSTPDPIVMPAATVYPLTGLPVADPAIAARPALIVKIDNSGPARPQTGTNEADIVVEEIINDASTRFAMIFQSGESDPVGPCRSGRIQDINIFGSLNHPLFAWSGGNKTVTAAIRASDLVDIGPSRANVYYRTSDRQAPHNLYSKTANLFAKAPVNSQRPAQQFDYRADGEPVAGGPASGVTIHLDSVVADWRWDPTRGLYMRTTNGVAHVDRVSGQVSTNNVVVLQMDYAPGLSGSPDAQTTGTGETFVFTGGHYIHGTWTRPDRLHPFALADDSGNPIALTAGRTFIELPRPGTTAPQP